MKKKFLISHVIYLSLICFFCLNVILLAGNGKLKGKVIDGATGDPLPFANISITHSILDDGTEVSLQSFYGAATDLDGYYVILNVPPGTYVMSASMVGFAKQIKKGIEVSSDRTIEVNYSLGISTVEMDQVVITAKKELIKSDVSATQEVVTIEEIESMPVLRVDAYLNRMKGVELTSNQEGAGLSVRGGSIRETDIRMDGISLQDPRSENSYLGFNWVCSLKCVTSFKVCSFFVEI